MWRIVMSRPAPAISDVRFTPGSRADVATGLLGWVACVVDDRLVLDGITLRRTASGRLALSFPERRTATGAYPYMRPVDAPARRDIEQAIFRAIAAEVAP
jgi:DNA-binding cell septation regulator SpoVG